VSCNLFIDIAESFVKDCPFTVSEISKEIANKLLMSIQNILCFDAKGIVFKRNLEQDLLAIWLIPFRDFANAE
jgi:hypothetical protein